MRGHNTINLGDYVELGDDEGLLPQVSAPTIVAAPSLKQRWDGLSTVGKVGVGVGALLLLRCLTK